MEDTDESAGFERNDDGSFNDPFDLFGRDPSPYTLLSLQEELIRDPLFRRLCNDVVRPNAHLFQGKVVLEVDCGLGLLSTVVSQFAKKVIAVENSRLADLLSKSVARNKIENIIVIKDDIDEIESLPDEVDILMSQYMGFLLYDKNLLARYLKARDKFLKPGGIMMPDYIHVFISGVGHVHELWKSREYLQMGRILEEPIEKLIPLSKIATDDYMIRKLNLRTFRIDNYNHRHKFYLIVGETCKLDAFVLHFEIGFSRCHKRVFLSNSPFAEPTRWKQLVLFAQNPVVVQSGNTLSGQIAMSGVKRDDDKSVTRFAIDKVRLLDWKEQRELYKNKGEDQNKKKQSSPFHPKNSNNCQTKSRVKTKRKNIRGNL